MTFGALVPGCKNSVDYLQVDWWWPQGTYQYGQRHTDVANFAVIKKQQNQIVYTHAMISFSFYAIAQLRINSKPNNK